MKNRINVLYVHGYMGSGSGETATNFKRLLNSDRYNFISPNFSNKIGDIGENILAINKIIDRERPLITIGNSLGSFEVMHSARYGFRMLINPVFNPVTDTLQPEIFDESFSAMSDKISELANSLKIEEGDKLMTYGFFGAEDDVVNCQPQFEKLFGTNQMTVFPGVGHQLFEPELKVLVDKIDKIMDMDEKTD